jgi:hypothetical protein
MSTKDKINDFLTKLPFNGLAEKIPTETRAKIPVLNKAIPFANQIACGLAVVFVFVAVACSRGGGGKSAPTSDFKYELTKDKQGIMITGYTGNGGKVIIPSTIEDYPVTEIGYMALRGQSQTEYFAANNITELVIPKSVVTLSSFAFYWIDNLKSVTLPDGIKVLPASVFGDCVNLTTINLPTSLEEIGGKAFMNCGELVNLTIPSSLTSVKFSADMMDDRYAFRNCKKLPIKTRQALEGLGYKSGF